MADKSRREGTRRERDGVRDAADKKRRKSVGGVSTMHFSEHDSAILTLLFMAGLEEHYQGLEMPPDMQATINIPLRPTKVPPVREADILPMLELLGITPQHRHFDKCPRLDGGSCTQFITIPAVDYYRISQEAQGPEGPLNKIRDEFTRLRDEDFKHVSTLAHVTVIENGHNWDMEAFKRLRGVDAAAKRACTTQPQPGAAAEIGSPPPPPSPTR